MIYYSTLKNIGVEDLRICSFLDSIRILDLTWDLTAATSKRYTFEASTTPVAVQSAVRKRTCFLSMFADYYLLDCSDVLLL